MEIERKWLFNMEKVPVELSETVTHYKQGYLSIYPEVRVRSKRVENLKTGETTDTTYMLCIKGEGTLTRHEIQKHLTKEEFEALMEVGDIEEKDLIDKHYYTINIEGKKLTVGTVDKGTPTEFSYGEIEFNSEEEALNFQAPDWFGEDVTDDKSYKMKNYWKRLRLEKRSI